MKTKVIDLEGKRVKEVNLPKVFSAPYRPDLINRAFWIVFTHKLQPKGTDPEAGERTSAESWGVGHGVARVARVKGSRYPRAGQAAGISGVVKGRATHPPRAEKRIHKEINKKERRLAIASAIAATAMPDVVRARGHRIPNKIKLPLVVVDKLEKVDKTKELKAFLEKIGLSEELERVISRSVRSGTSRRRGRRKKIGKGPLIVVSKDEGITKAGKNIPGVDVIRVDKINILDLAPGGNGGRLTIWTESALKKIPPTIAEVVKVAA
jgi:large subunit ribosomal protein L4e